MMTAAKGNSLSQIKEHYEREGYAIIRNVIDDPDLLREAADHVQWLLAKNPHLRGEELRHQLMKNDPFWVRLCSDDRLLDVAEQFVGPDIALFSSRYFYKVPFMGKAVPWHQDGSYWPLEPMEVISFWLAIEDSTVENGCMRVIPRTHRRDFLPLQPRKTGGPEILEGGPDIIADPALFDESQAVDIVLKAGDISLHHPKTIHSSKTNNSPRSRTGVTMRFIPTTTRVISEAEGFVHTLFLVRGRGVPGINVYRPFPRYEEGVHMPFRGCDEWNER
jgi:phytanoyl-CoA hydroxylase